MDNGIEVELRDGLVGFIRKAELSRDRAEQRPDRFAVGEKVDAKITTFDPKSRKIALSIKQREAEEEKKAMADYGSTESGASLGDILGAAISKAAQERDAAGSEKAKPAKSSKKKAEAKAEDDGEAEDD
jgi:small subunit ribosomal protein S1